MSDYLVSTGWLAEHPDDPRLRIIDVRGHMYYEPGEPPEHLGHYADYLESHIPGAVFLEWTHELCDDPQHLQLPNPADFAAVMARLGVSDDTLVIAYCDAGGSIAARLWWTLHQFGHPNVAVLDGGWIKWASEGRPTTADIPQVEPAAFTVLDEDGGLYRTGQDVLMALNSTTQFLDVRTPEEYRGEITFARQRGHIPGAVNIPIAQLTHDDGTLLPPDRLRRRCEAAGLDESAPEIVVYSNVGVDSSLGLLALAVAGYENISHYDGGWYEWGNDLDKPVEMEESAFGGA